MILKIQIESDQLITKNKRDGSGTYQVQEAWAYTYGVNGLHPHPQRIELFPQKIGGKVQPYSVGYYALSPESLSVKYARLDIFIRLIPWDQALHQLKQQIVEEKKAA